MQPSLAIVEHDFPVVVPTGAYTPSQDVTSGHAPRAMGDVRIAAAVRVDQSLSLTLIRRSDAVRPGLARYIGTT